MRPNKKLRLLNTSITECPGPVCKGEATPCSQPLCNRLSGRPEGDRPWDVLASITGHIWPYLSEAGVDSRKGDDDGPLKWLGPLFRSRPQPPRGLWFQKATWKAPSWVICKASPRAWGAVPMAESLTCPPVTELTAVKERQQCGCGNVYSVFILTF